MHSIRETLTRNNLPANKIRTMKLANGKNGDFTCINNALLRGVLTPYELAVYCVLAGAPTTRRSNAGRTSRPLWPRRACSVRQVVRARDRLQELELIAVACERENRRAENVYTLLAVEGSSKRHSPSAPVCRVPAGRIAGAYHRP